METPNDRKYTRDHVWVEQMEEGRVRVGITDFAQNQLGDIVYVELPAVGEAVRKDKAFGVVESVKAVSDLFAPVSGEVVGNNMSLEEDPALVNASPYGEGWMIEVSTSGTGEFEELLETEAYRRLTEDLGS